jgi:hypothetical protein
MYSPSPHRNEQLTNASEAPLAPSWPRNVIQQVQIGLINLSGGARHANFAGSAAGEISIMRLSDFLPSLNAAGRSGQLRK